jgi:hypothetical protein
MRVLCKANRGSNLSADHFKHGYTPLSEFDLQPAKEYIVYGINLWKGLLGYLVIGEGMYPYWYPSELFTITRNELPPNWYFSCFPKGAGFDLNAICGYEELVNAPDHYDALSNLEKSAIDVFVERMKQIDEIS